MFSEIKVFDKDGLRVDVGDTRLSGATSLAVALGPVGSGTYTVTWQVTSVSDAHRTSGSFRFTVSGGGRLFLGTGARVSQDLIDTRPTVANTLRRWGELAGMALVAGGVGTLIFVWRLALSAVSDETRVRLVRRLRLLTLSGLAAVAVAMGAEVLARVTALTADGPGLPEALRDVVFETQTGTLFLVRTVLAVALGLLWYRFTGAEVIRQRWLYLVTALSLMLLLGRSLGSHAAASEGSLAVVSVASDFIHLAAASLWVGGLVALLGGLDVIRRTDSEAIGRAVSRFSNLAVLSVGLIALTGLYNAWLEVGSLQAFPRTPYGQMLMIKTGILVPLLGLAAINLLGVRLGLVRYLDSRLTRHVGGLQRGSGPVVKGEILLAVAIFGMTALLANLPLARDAITRSTEASEAPLAMAVAVQARGLNVVLGVTPNRVGANTFLLELTDALGNAIEAETVATAQISRLTPDVQDIVVDTFVLEARGRGRFSARSDVLSIVGTWVTKVAVVVEGERPLSIDYVFRVADRSRERRFALSSISDFLTGRRPELARTGPLVPSGTEAKAGLELLHLADDSMNRLSSLRECNNINGVVTVLDYMAPDRMRYAVAGGGVSIIAGERQWYRRGDAPWELRGRGAAFRFPEFRFADDAVGVRKEGEHRLSGRPHEVVSFYSPRDDAEYWLWIDSDDHRISRLLMNVPPSHYMVSIFDGFDGPEGVPTPSGPEDRSVTVPPVPESVPCLSYLP